MVPETLTKVKAPQKAFPHFPDSLAPEGLILTGL